MTRGETTSEDDEVILHVSAEGETEVIGADVRCPPEVAILNPELHLARLTDPEAKLEMELWR